MTTYATSCPRCTATGGRAHSFEWIGHLRDGTSNIFYTSLADATDPEDSPDTLTGYIHHMKEVQHTPWIWILDCRDMKSKDLLRTGFVKQLTDVVHHVYFETLHAVYILHPTMTMNALIQCIKPFLYKETRKRIHLCNMGLIDTMNRLENAGIPRSEMTVITKKIAHAR